MKCRLKNQPSVARWLAIALLCALATVGTNIVGQQDLHRTPDNLNRQFVPVYQTSPGTGILVLSVFAEKSSVPLDRQALLKLVNRADQKVTWQATEDASRGAFTEITFGEYDVEISAVGYSSEHREVHVTKSDPILFDIVLHRDPSGINLDVAEHMMSAKARKETKAAVAALKSGNYPKAQKHLDSAFKVDPSSSEINFLFGYLNFQQNKFKEATGFLATATTANPHNGAALTLLGRAFLEQRDYESARPVLEHAVVESAENWLPHDLLADAYFHQKDYAKARDEAETAIAEGKNQAGAARLVLGQALINLGQNAPGIAALQAFLADSPRHPMAGSVQRLIAELQQSYSSDRSAADSEDTKSRLAGVDPLQALSAPGLEMKAWQPPGIDETEVALAKGVTCPVEKVLDEAGKHVEELVQDVTKFAAVEDLIHQNLDTMGNPIRTETRKYNYVAAITEPEPGYLAVDEYRADKLELSDYPDKIASTGFASLALVFHPHMRSNFEIRCAGLGDWRGRASWIVNFVQRDDKPNRMHSYKMGGMSYSVKLRGRAWITADKFQIVRVESEMVRPMPEIKLLSEHQVVEYGPVRFDKKNMSLWLPRSAEIYFDFRQRRYYRRHSFDHYMLFSVDSDEKRKEPHS